MSKTSKGDPKLRHLIHEVSKKYVAIRVCTADSDPHELNVLSDLSNSRRDLGDSLGKAMIPFILDTFEIQGPNGTHACYVTLPAKMSLSNVKDGSYIRLFKLEVARALAAQSAVAVEYVHSQGFAHGDLHYGNVLIQLPSGLDYGQYGQPETVAITRFDGKELPSSKILLSDFGEAFSPTREKKFESHTPLVNRAPETRFESANPLSFPSDIWSLACSIWDIIGQNPLFEGFLATEDDIACEHVDALGILPPDGWNKWEVRRNMFSEDGKPIDCRPYQSWEDRFEDSVQQPRQAEGMPLFEPAERDALFSMLRPMLSFKPESRLSTKEVLASEWMVKWALPECATIWKS
ncbi:kinase-like domain-containing protein [Aspergillus pseudonomiae]|uniref:Kinase-like domain-containing protein n=1 Tax=Aspergillus pseudonomiae TaxID=1506151 RepID=A0A5N7D7S8_9EURO|nr:kinase-like domain-containing protein [Aspergillus pseudonomiae]KAE8402471.1 kinase-like domain-containing protein [Aspergillus pseudonomiae]